MLFIRQQILVLISVLGILALAVWIYMMPALSRIPISHVRVVGELREITEISLREAVSAHLAKGFFGIDVAAVRKDILELPWLKSVSVRRTWPKSLRIAVLEYEAEARWYNGGLIATDGTLFQPLPNSYPTDLPILKGTSGIHAEMLRQYRELRLALRTIKRKIRQFTRTERPIWEVELNDGLVIVVGDQNSVSVIKQFASAATAVFGERIDNVSRVDLRYANGFSVRWHNVSSDASEPVTEGREETNLPLPPENLGYPE
uniref:Cell division protein FtsQ n=1 Tax=Candidatus Kentrum sp. SD TaxID=2126332 RepID=A0A450YU28_9GAMM|nr:MAG: cell division protein FtsQ [Candidatus Kentron sp. SD]VFK44992.1 MAG: cell division protein FtsQ [Candidatus Kentron sp. SD]VFK80750.1 MAG: cell division protein FtsQ [Candidatus Kentron sp. SD]